MKWWYCRCLCVGGAYQGQLVISTLCIGRVTHLVGTCSCEYAKPAEREVILSLHLLLAARCGRQQKGCWCAGFAVQCVHSLWRYVMVVLPVQHCQYSSAVIVIIGLAAWLLSGVRYIHCVCDFRSW
jgi:hypothetical protein